MSQLSRNPSVLVSSRKGALRDETKTTAREARYKNPGSTFPRFRPLTVVWFSIFDCTFYKLENKNHVNLTG